MAKSSRKFEVKRDKFRGERRPFKCPIPGCPRTYAVEYYLQRHIKTNHYHGRDRDERVREEGERRIS